MKKLVLFLLAFLVATVATVSLTLAQTTQPQPRIVSGNDIGFRLEGTDPSTGRPTGTLMLRLNGEWIQVAFSGGLRLLK